MKVLFLCGGIGKRMFPITEDKFSLKFLGKTLLEHQVELAKKAGLTDFIIVGNHGNIDSIKEIVSVIPGINVEFTIQEQPLGIADALQSASQLLDDEIIVVNTNDLFESSAYTSLIETHRTRPAVSYLLGYEVSNHFPGGYLVVGGDGKLTNIVEKPEPGQEPSNLVNVLVHLHTDPRTLLKHAADIKTGRDDAYERAIDAMAEDTHGVRVLPYTGLWTAIKYPWHIFKVVRQFLEQSPGYISPSARISEKATIEGKVFISDDAIVLENAVIKGPVYIGPRSVVGTGCLVREYSHIGSDCVAGFSTEIKNSYIADRCWFHMNYIGDSIIGEGCSFGAGTVLSNWRFDENNIKIKIEGRSIDTGLDKFGAIIGNNSKTGVNVSVMPGVRIGPNSIVGSHVCLTQDLGPDKMVLVDSVLKTVRNLLGSDKDTALEAAKKDEKA
jgi:UDP-N-acetylglucosamine diphosphorylase/glucosamine-1-phosphate N-acetyltransferase